MGCLSGTSKKTKLWQQEALKWKGTLYQSNHMN